MSAFKGPRSQKLNGGLGRRNASTDGIIGLICGGVATDDLALGDVVKLIQLTDAENIGINASYDANNDILVHHHIKEFFRYSPAGTLYLMLVAQGTSLTDMCDVTNDNLKKLILSDVTNREAKIFGCVLNPDMATYVATITNGIDADVTTAALKAQELVDQLYGESVFVDSVLLEGRDAGGTIATIENFRDMACPNVSPVIAADPIVSGSDSAYASYAAVGAALGMLSVRKVHESLGSVDIIQKPESKIGEENYPLTDKNANAWLQASISDGTAFSELTVVERDTLDSKGYIYAGFYEGYPGVYFNDSPTSTELTDDFAYIEMNRVWNKAARYIRTALMPKMKGTINVNNSTGFIFPSTIASWENSAYKQVNNMLKDEEVSDIKIYINPEQNVLAGDPIVVNVKITPKGIARDIINQIGFNNPFK